MTHNIGTLNEKSLHADLKTWYAKSDDQFEVKVANFVIDIVRDDLLIEIQTRGFSAMKRKLTVLLQQGHRVHLIHPIAQEKWIVKQDPDPTVKQKRRKSPKRGALEHIFVELVSFPQLMLEPNFSLEVVLIQEEEVRHHTEGRRNWRRRGWGTHERRLLSIVQQQQFTNPADLGGLLPPNLADTFTTTDIAEGTQISTALAGKMAYCLRQMKVIEAIGKQGRSILYKRV